jgi:hypothetical protein
MMRRRLGAGWILGALTLSGCYSTVVTTKTIESGRSEQRAPLSISTPLWRSHWRVEADAIVSQLDVQQCRTSQAWTSSDVRTTRRIAHHTGGGVFLGFGALANVAAVATWEWGIDRRAPSRSRWVRLASFSRLEHD